MKHFEAIILGGGASGTMCAMSTYANNVAIIDNQNKLAKKLLVTGNGKCNLTNVLIQNHNSEQFYNANIQKYLTQFSVQDSLAFFKAIGLETYADQEGRVYPYSNSAKSVLDVITRQITKNGVTTFLEHQITSIKKDNDTFFVCTDKENFSCKKLVFCLGGNKSDLLLPFGLKNKESVPSLCALKTKPTKNLTGQRLENVLVKATNYKTGETKSEMGDVLFKDEGLSGIVIFNMSSYFSRSSDFSGKIEIDLLPQINENDLFELLQERRKLNVPVSDFFVGLFINPISYEIFSLCKTNENQLSKQLTENQIKQFVQVIKHLPFEVKGFYDNNQVFSGGICLSDLNDRLESKKVSNLFVCGEACDVDGLCGGFNLQWAWTSGHIVGKQL